MLNNMKRTTIMILPLLTILSSLASCGNMEEDVPGRKYPPGHGEPVEEKFNDIGIEAHKDGEPYDTYEGLVMTGYQGWHGCPGDGSKWNQYTDANKWPHYIATTINPFKFEPGPLGTGFSFWPDCSEYEKTYDAIYDEETGEGWKMADGSQAKLFSSYDQSTVFTHFRWMKEYGIDGAFAQRFMVYVNEQYEADHDLHLVNLDHQMKASNEYGRAIAIMYDLVGMNEVSHLTPEYLMQDLAKLEAKYNFKDRSKGQKYYLYHNGKPLVALVSFAQMDMKYNMTECVECVRLLKEAGYSVMVGVPTYWRTGGHDSPYTAQLLSMLTDPATKPDVLMPWYTGRFDYKGEVHDLKGTGRAISFDAFKDRITADSQWCRNAGILFAPNCWPGFDWSHQRPASLPYKRYGGDFMWAQAYHEIAVAGVHAFYIGMYDEIDEGTQIFKVHRKKDAPSNAGKGDFYIKYVNGVYSTSFRGPSENEKGEWNSATKWWIRNDMLDSSFNGVDDDQETDHYLWLTGQIGKMLRGEIPLQSKQPKRTLENEE